MIDIVPSFIQQHPSPLSQGQGQVKVMDLEMLNVKVFLRAHIFQTIWWILFIFGMMIDTGPKFYSAIPPAHAHGFKVKVKDFYIKVF